jgi:toxin ParE1/3/4
MPRLLIRPQAENDLDEIWWHIAQGSPQNADRFLDLIEETCIVISGYPNMGERRDELLKELRSFPVGNYLIFYIHLNDGIDIIRVLHGARDWKLLLQ